jgi:hypothetical protein
LLVTAAIMVGMELQFHPNHDSSKFWQTPEAVCTVWAPDDGRRNHLKHVERFIEINKLSNVAPCWLNFGNILKIHGLMNIKWITSTSVYYCSMNIVTSYTEWKVGPYLS